MIHDSKRIVFLVDMNSFFVSCELIRKPELKKKPLVIATRGKRSVISAASYSAKELGIDSATNLQNALMRYPELEIVPPDFDYYRECSKKIMKFLAQFSDNLRVSSIDEAYLDVTHYFKDTPKTDENIQKLARFIQGKLLKQLGFPSNIGISTNKFLAKMASELRKPFAIESIYTSEIEEKLWPMPIGEMYGIGKKSAQILRYIHIKTIGEFAQFENQQLLESLLGQHIIVQQQMARGVFADEDVEVKPRESKISISQSRTFAEDVVEYSVLENKFAELWKNIVEELEEKKIKFRSIRIFYKKADFQTMQRSFTFMDFTDDYQYVYEYALSLFSSLWDGEEIRLVGIGVADFIKVEAHAEQLSMFQLDKPELVKKLQQQRRDSAIEQLTKTFNIQTGSDFFTNKKMEEDENGS